MGVTIYHGPALQFGMPTEEESKWTIEGLPSDAIKWKIRFRPDDLATIRVKTPSGVHSFFLVNGGGKWMIREDYTNGLNRTA